MSPKTDRRFAEVVRRGAEELHRKLLPSRARNTRTLSIGVPDWFPRLGATNTKAGQVFDSPSSFLYLAGDECKAAGGSLFIEAGVACG
jgi:hypothetical protein